MLCVLTAAQVARTGERASGLAPIELFFLRRCLRAAQLMLLLLLLPLCGKLTECARSLERGVVRWHTERLYKLLVSTALRQRVLHAYKRRRRRRHRGSR